MRLRVRMIYPSHTPYTGSSLVSGSYNQFIEKIRNSKKEVVKATHWRVMGGNAFFVIENTGRANVELSQMYMLGKIC